LGRRRPRPPPLPRRAAGQVRDPHRRRPPRIRRPGARADRPRAPRRRGRAAARAARRAARGRRPVTATTAERLVDGVLALPPLPPDVERLARLHLLDAVGVGLAASRVGPARGLLDLARPAGPCTVLGAATGTQPGEAALVNGTLVHSLEYDDTHTASVMHGSSVLAPVVLAVAEETGAGGTEVLRAFAAGWEVLVRFGLATP